MNLLTQLGIFSSRKKKQVIYTIILIIAIITIVFIWFPQLIPWKLITINSQSSLREQYKYRKAVKYLNVVNNFLENDLSLIKNLNKINTSNQFRLPVSHGRSNPFLP